jgi:SPP1 family phage portal protein
MITRAKRYLDEAGMPSPAMLRSVLAEHLAEAPRLGKLAGYYRGDSEITRRVRQKGLPNNRIAHPYARYIVSVATGYLIGQPVNYSVDGGEDALQPVTDAYSKCSISSIDAENARHASIYGRGVEYVHVSENDEGQVLPCVAALSPEQAFVVYDDDYHNTPLFGVYYAKNTTEEGDQDGWRVYLMGDRSVRECHMTDLSASAVTVVGETPHYFGGVPMIEYWNDEDERGDFEWVLPLIDAYDKLQSDRVNDKEQFVDALLLLTGCTIEDDERGRPPWQQLREDKALSLPDIDAKAEYLSKQLSESDVEVLRTALVADIHKMSMIPDLSDREFASNASGVAMKYKLWGLEQMTNVKQQWFIEGLKTRLKLFANFCKVQGRPALNVDDVKITMTRAMPANLVENAQMAQYAEAAGAASTETKVRMLHAADGWTDEMVRDEVDKIKGDEPTQSIDSILSGTASPGDE